MTFALALLAALVLEALLEARTRTPLLATLAGRALAALLRGRRVARLAEGRHEVHEIARFPRVFRLVIEPAAMASGRVVLVRAGRRTRALERHEAVHVRQFERLGSLGFLAAYVAQWLWQLARTRDPRAAYHRISFEVEAYREQHGASWRPPRRGP